MFKKIKTEIFVFLAFLILIIVLNLVFILLIRGTKQKDKLFIEYSVERIFHSFIEAYYQDNLENQLKKNNNVIGFGIYHPDGEAIIIIGQAPLRIRDFNGYKKPPKAFKYNNKDRSITLIRPVGSFRKNMPRHSMHDDRPPERWFKIGLIEIDIKNYYRKGYTTLIILIIVPVLFLLFTIILGVLYWRNIEFKNQFEKQTQLAKLGEVSRTLSHEIKNPLGAIRIQTGYLKKILPENQEDLKVIDEEIERISLLTSRIGDFIRDPIGTPDHIDIVKFLKETIKRFNKKIIINNNFTSSVNIKFDRDRLRSVIENVIINAIESMENINKNNIVEINISTGKKNIEIIVLDRGKGLPDNYETNIYDPYYTTKTKGSGLGLAITQRFIKAQGGEIHITKRPGGGTEVHLIFHKE